MQHEATLPESEEHAQHVSAIQSLSEKHHLPAVDIATLYERELASLRQNALITNYLSIFVSRRVNETLRALRLSTQQASTPDTSAQ